VIERKVTEWIKLLIEKEQGKKNTKKQQQKNIIKKGIEKTLDTTHSKSCLYFMFPATS